MGQLLRWALWLTLLGPVATPAVAQDACTDCHDLDAERFSASVHGGFDCTDCHVGEEDPGEPGHGGSAACSPCHEDVVEEYEASIHGVSRVNGLEEAPACQTCHGDIHRMPPGDDPESPVHALALPETCGSCHANPEVVGRLGIVLKPLEAYRASVHARAVADHRHGPTCSDCHTSHDVHPASDPRSTVFHTRVPETCAGCHADIAKVFVASVHGKAAGRGIREAPVCTDCHGEHRILSPKEHGSPVFATNVPRMTCGRCHGDLRLSEKFGIPGDRVPSFEDSYHGLASRAGTVTVAHCGSCHGVHDILPSSDPASHVHLDRLPKTCGNCHPGAGRRFALGPVHVDPTKPHHAAVYWVRIVYLWLIVVTIGGMVLHNMADWLRKLVRPPPAHPPPPGPAEPRMALGFRVAHWLMMVSFLVLVYTGFALKYPESWWARPLLGWEETLGVRGLLHRIAAVMMLASLVVHVLHLVIDRRARACIAAMRPRLDDLRELRERLLFFVGRREEPPHTGRFGYPEKMEYIALMWGILVMSITGFVLWFEGWSLRLLPKWASDVATVIHLYEAILASLAILVWHLYFVIFDPVVYPMDTAWLTGRSPAARIAERSLEARPGARRRRRRADPGKKAVADAGG